MALRRSVITGLGVVSPLGLGAAAYWDALCAGRSGIRTIRNFDASALPVDFGGEIEGFDPKLYLDKKDRKRLNVMPRSIQLAVAAAQLAFDDCGADKERLDPTRFGVEFGVGTIPGEMLELGQAAQLSADLAAGKVDLEKWGAHGLPTIPPMWMLCHVPNMPASHVSILHNAQGPNNSITQSDVAGLLALGEARRILIRGQADFFLVGGADSKINPITMTRHCKFNKKLSHRRDAPAAASRPFDRDRDGMVLGEGGGVFVLEDLDHARQRGARIIAEVVGFGAAFDRQLTGRGLVRAIHAALGEAGIGPGDLDHINAQGYSDVELDAFEARGLREAFAGQTEGLPVLAVKSYFGNLGSGSASTELAASLLALTHGTRPATLNHERPDPNCPLRVDRQAQAVTRPHVLKIAFTELGQCAAAVVRKWSD